MGCVASRVDEGERVVICKERKRLMKQLVGLRREFAGDQFIYLRALKNTGVTLRQLTESQSLDPETALYRTEFPSSPPLPLPPSPPPPPPFSPDLTPSNENEKEDVSLEESISIDADGGSPPPPPVTQSSSWNFWDPFDPSSPEHSLEPQGKSEIVDPVNEEEDWEETKTEFEEDQEDKLVGDFAAKSVARKQPHPAEWTDDNSSAMSWHTTDAPNLAAAAWKSRKTVHSVIKELDDYFLNASAGAKDIAVLMDICKGDNFLPQHLKENKRKRNGSTKVLSALTWSWSSKSLQLAKDAFEICGPREPCNPGANQVTLDKLYAAEQKLFKLVKEEEVVKMELEKKSALLQKQEEENHDQSRKEKIRSNVEELETDISRLQYSISTTCSSILEIIDVELYPQLVALISGLQSLWRKMYECHQVQNHISQQLNLINDEGLVDMTTDYHRQATVQLEAEVNHWFISFCKLVKDQRDYAGTLSRWIKLTDCLVDDHQQSNYASVVRSLSEKWHIAFDKLPDKVVSEAIKSLLSAIQSVMQQQAEEFGLRRKSAKLEKRLHKELLLLDEMEKKMDWGLLADGESNTSLSPKHPLSLKRAKIEFLKKRVDTEKTKYQNSVQVTRAMILSNLKTSLPNVFQALMGFSSAYAKALEATYVHNESVVGCDASETSASQHIPKTKVSDMQSL